jgi:FdhE protein
VRGVERARHLRCSRCGAGWQTSCLLCTYCATTDHDALQSLIVESSVPPSTIEVCKRCNGYVKALSVLQACPPASVVLTDLLTAELDFSVVGRGCHRPGGLGHSLDVRLAASH